MTVDDDKWPQKSDKRLLPHGDIVDEGCHQLLDATRSQFNTVKRARSSSSSSSSIWIVSIVGRWQFETSVYPSINTRLDWFRGYILRNVIYKRVSPSTINGSNYLRSIDNSTTLNHHHQNIQCNQLSWAVFITSGKAPVAKLIAYQIQKNQIIVSGSV
jgi:hypothetical protein